MIQPFFRERLGLDAQTLLVRAWSVLRHGRLSEPNDAGGHVIADIEGVAQQSTQSDVRIRDEALALLGKWER